MPSSTSVSPVPSLHYLGTYLPELHLLKLTFLPGGHGRKSNPFAPTSSPQLFHPNPLHPNNHPRPSTPSTLFPSDPIQPNPIHITTNPTPTAMFDLATSATSQTLIREFYEAGRIVSAVCHGPAVLINAKLSDGTYLIANSAVTGFSNAEEAQVGLTDVMPFLLETELDKNSGGRFEKAAEPWGVKVAIARGGRLITGQNPASATAVGEAVYEAIFGDGKNSK